MTASQTPEAILHRLELKIARRLEGLLQGDHRSLFRGQGLDLADIREYQYYDDVRHIDWNVTARQQVPYVREYLEDREVTAWFLLDMSPSVDFQSVSVSKRQVLDRIHHPDVSFPLEQRQSDRGAFVLRRGGAHDPGAGRAAAIAGAARRAYALPQSQKCPRHRFEASSVGCRPDDQAAFSGFCRVRFHLQSGLGKAAGAIGQPP